MNQTSNISPNIGNLTSNISAAISNYTSDNTSIAANDSSSDTIGVPCLMNVDCQKSSWCCSGGKCVPGSTCYYGSKLIDDFCQYEYECLSRCCTKNACSNFVYCAKTCTDNSNCVTGCCSFGYCSAPNVCAGRKADRDTCDKDKECISSSCSTTNLPTTATLVSLNNSSDVGVCQVKS